MNVHFSLNGSNHQCEARAERRLATILRDECGVTTTRTACDIGRCGACMVLWNGRAVNSCLVMAWQVDGAEIFTAEGLDRFLEGRIVMMALAQENSFQCGYCAPGFVVTLTALLRERGTCDELTIRQALEGNICRCTGYHSIVRGALRAVEMLADRTTTATKAEHS